MATGKTITQRIALEGGAQITAQLNAIGKAGVDAFATIRKAASDNSLFKSIAASFDAVKAKALELGASARDIGQRFNDLGNSLQNSARRVGVLTAVISAAVFGFQRLFKGATDAADAINDAAEAIGISTRVYQELAFAANQAGVSQEKFKTAQERLARAAENTVKADEEQAKQIRKLGLTLDGSDAAAQNYTKRLLEIRAASAEAKDGFARFGVEVAKNKDGSVDLEETQLRLADAFKESTDANKKLSVVLELHGRGQANMVNFYNQGSAAIKAQRKEAQRLGLVIEDDVLKRQAKLGDAFDKLGVAANAARVRLTAAFSPTLLKLVDGIVEAMAKWRGDAQNLANTLAAKLLPVVDDFLSLLSGRGAGIKEGSIVLQIRDAVVDTAKAVDSAVNGIIIPAFKALFAALSVVAEAINGLFGTKFTGGTLLAAAVILKLVGAFSVLVVAAKLVFAVIGAIVVAVGAVPAAIIAVVAAVALFVAFNTNALKTVQTLWTNTWAAITAVVTRVFTGVQTIASRIASGFSAAGAAILAGITTAVNAIGSLFSMMWAAVVAQAQTIATNIVSFFTFLPQAFGVLFTAIAQVVATAWAAVVAGAQSAVQGIINIFAVIAQTIATALLALPAVLAPIFAAVVAIAQVAWTGLQNAVTTLVNFIVNAFKTGVAAITGFFTGLLDSVLAVFDKIMQAASKVVSAVKGATSGGGVQRKDGGPAFAGGGHVRGAGGPRSDSIRAWLSNGEFVINAAAVKKYGASLFAALNGMRLPLGDLQFNTGGFVDAFAGMTPRTHFASGGLVGAKSSAGGRPLTLALPGGESIGGFTASDDAVSQLQRYALKRNVRSTGRKPQWFGG